MFRTSDRVRDSVAFRRKVKQMPLGDCSRVVMNYRSSRSVLVTVFAKSWFCFGTPSCC
jgi:hypothetical protein